MTLQWDLLAAEQDFARQVHDNQMRLRSALLDEYDFVVCGAGTTGCVVARRLAENPDVTVLLLEAGGDDDAPSVINPALWPENLGTERDWGFISEPNRHLGGRRLQMSMGKTLGGGSTINAMAWSRGHASDWDLFAAESADQSWNYHSVLDIYRRIEAWGGAPDTYRGTDGPVFVQPAQDPHPVATALLDAARTAGIPAFDHPNGRLMESCRGVALGDLRIRDGRRLSIFRSYTYPYMDRPNLTVLTHTVVRRLIFNGSRVAGIDVDHGGTLRHIGVGAEVVVSLGAINTPKVLMLSGLGDAQELGGAGIAVVQHLPGVGKNLQDHTAFDCVWEYRDDPVLPRNNGSETVIFEHFNPTSMGPDVFVWQAETPLSTPENVAQYGLPEAGWTLFSAIAHPKSRGRVLLSGSSPDDPVRIDTNALSDTEDLVSARRCMTLCRELGNSAPLRDFVKREVMPGDLSGTEMDAFIRRATRTFWHQSGTARMGHDENAVVDGHLSVYGVENLRIADASIMPRITTGNTMAPCVIIGEKAAESIRTAHQI
jgi:choline dehydrogenase